MRCGRGRSLPFEGSKTASCSLFLFSFHELCSRLTIVPYLLLPRERIGPDATLVRCFPPVRRLVWSLEAGDTFLRCDDDRYYVFVD